MPTRSRSSTRSWNARAGRCGERRAPKWARWFLRVTVRGDRREDLIGDLNEMHKRRSGSFAWLSTSLVGVTGLASFGPARRAASVDPLTALREE